MGRVVMRERWVDTRRLWRFRLGFAVRAFCAAVCALVVVAPWLILFLLFLRLKHGMWRGEDWREDLVLRAQAKICICCGTWYLTT